MDGVHGVGGFDAGTAAVAGLEPPKGVAGAGAGAGTRRFTLRSRPQFGPASPHDGLDPVQQLVHGYGSRFTPVP